MLDRATKLRLRRLYRRRRRQVEDLSTTAEEGLEQHFIRRLTRLVEVRRFVITWLLLIILLIGGVIFQARALGHYYQTIQPVSGGVYTEGIQGLFTDANPLYASGSVDSAVSRLLFSGLLKYDQHNRLVGDLAKDWSSDSDGLNYTVHLRPGLKWQDGQSLTSADVLFTYQTIQNPDAGTLQNSSWQGIKISAPDPLTVTFQLPNPFSAFPETLTNGIVPAHLLNGIPVTRLRSIAFNTAHPVGSGPFKWEAIQVSGADPDTQEQQIALVPNETYYGGKAKLSKFIVRAFNDPKQLQASFDKQELTGAAGLETVSDADAHDPNVHSYNIPLTAAVMVFLKNSDPILQDVKVRQALTMATDVPNLISGLGYPVISASEPLLKGDVGYSKDAQQSGFNLASANQLLDQAGWAKGANGIRQKGGKPLTFKLYSQSTSEYSYVTQTLQKQWRQVGVDAQVNLQADTDLQTTISFHNYDALVYGISMGSDPDVFAYWDGSQADVRSPTRLNLSEYKSAVADQALEAGRTRSDATLRAAKYHTFLDAWRSDAPAIALYQPRFLYLTRGIVYGFQPTTLNAGADRFSNVENWEIRQARTSQ